MFIFNGLDVASFMSKSIKTNQALILTLPSARAGAQTLSLSDLPKHRKIQSTNVGNDVSDDRSTDRPTIPLTI